MGLLLGAPWQRLNPATLEGMEAMAATEVATTVASEDCTTSARGLLMPRLMLNPASTVALEDMEAMAAMVATTVASGDCTTSARSADADADAEPGFYGGFGRYGGYGGYGGYYGGFRGLHYVGKRSADAEPGYFGYGGYGGYRGGFYGGFRGHYRG